MVGPKSFRPWNPEQTLLLPLSPVDWLLENHLVFFMVDLAAEIDPAAIHIHDRQDGGLAAVRHLRRAAQLQEDGESLLGRRCLPGTDRQPAVRTQRDAEAPLMEDIPSEQPPGAR